MKYFFFSIALLFCIQAYAQVNRCDSIVWRPNRPLVWTDYKARPDTNSIVAAYTNSGFIRTWSAKDYRLYTSMVTYFYPCVSWRKGEASERLLAHEQLHFDITEYFKRMYFKKVVRARYTPATLPQLMDLIYQDVIAGLQVMQREYDIQTKHSLDEKQQAIWQRKVKRLLNSTKAYDKPELIVQLPK
ncbi:hypothetical protein [uncultured Mucilaginibacter sp.]|uniref:hypothetical protein n=1 Tax=uncultured Mucilaginibacter sp. TaxID=797541 RepID=UPI0025D62451|nr:hypothetical protein [uncultured Mucilaginibacter sp.]